MAKVEFSKPKELPKEWQDYRWAIYELERHFESVRWQLLDLGSQLAVGVRDKLRYRKVFYLKGKYHGPNAKLRKLSYVPSDSCGEESPATYDDPDWQVFDIMKQPNSPHFLSKIIETIKSEFNLKQQGAFQ